LSRNIPGERDNDLDDSPEKKLILEERQAHSLLYLWPRRGYYNSCNIKYIGNSKF